MNNKPTTRPPAGTPTRESNRAPACQARRRSLLAGLVAALGWAPLALRAQTPPASEARAGPPPPVGSRLELPELPLLDGRTLRPSDTAGQVLVLYWWASWCPFCAVQSPLIDKLGRSHQGRGLRVVGLSIDKKPEEAAAHLARQGYGFASAWVSPAISRVLPKPKGLPVTVVIGRDGRVVMSEAGQLFPEDIEGIARFL
jgi:thiol-disulfide isomerase/thioredoxin